VRLSLRVKVFLVLLLAMLAVVVVLAGIMHWSFRKGFVDFLESRQQARVERLVANLAELHRQEGGWDDLRQDRTRWWRMLAEGRGGGPGGPRGPGHGLGAGRGLEGGLALFDADKLPLFGRPVDPARMTLTPIQSEGRVVGYVGRFPGRDLGELVDVRFLEAQQRALLGIALLVGILAAALSWPLANALARPLRRLADAARELTLGRFQARVAVRGNDELADLARDFNDLAHTLEHTEQARRQWMADISHELRTPLAVLRAELEAVQDGVRPMDAGTVASLHADVERLNRLVEDLYQLSMTDMGAMSYHKRPVDPLALLRDDVDTLRGEFERHGLGLELHAPQGGAVTLRADPDRLSQLFRNLLQNSLRYSDAGGRLEIRAEVAEGRLALDFDDTPPGVPEAALEHVFDRFYRVEASRSRAHGGAGLGLAICRNIVAAHAGRISARHSPLGGLGVRVELPLDT
jgi:two-component system sensor histidine kinase BaeS